MSAFVLDQDHIDLLITAAMRIPGFNEKYINIPKTADLLGQDLWAENYRSVNYRYDEEEQVPEYHWTPVAELQAEDPEISPLLQVLHATHCYEYQSCEHPGWTDSRAFWVCQAIEHWAEVELRARKWPKDSHRYAGDTSPPEFRGIGNMAWEWHRTDGFPAPVREEA